MTSTTNAIYRNDKGILVADQLEWWEYVDDDEDTNENPYYPDENPYYPDIAGREDYYDIALLMRDVFHRDLAREVHEMHLDCRGWPHSIWWVVRAPDSPCAMGCHRREKTGSVIACAHAEVYSGESVYITRVAVMESERRKGIGTLLMTTLVDYIDRFRPKMPMTKVTLHADASAVPFYLSMGWDAPKLERRGERMFGIPADSVFMRAAKEV